MSVQAGLVLLKSIGAIKLKNKEQLKKELNPIQYEVTQNNGTEPPFRNEYWNETRDGIYVDLVSGKPLFSSLDKYDAGCGWPSFTKPIEDEEVVEKPTLAILWCEQRFEVNQQTPIWAMYLMTVQVLTVCDTVLIRLP